MVNQHNEQEKIEQATMQQEFVATNSAGDVKVGLPRKELLMYVGMSIAVVIILWVVFNNMGSSKPKQAVHMLAPSTIDDQDALNTAAQKLHNNQQDLKQNPSLTLPPLTLEQTKNIDQKLSEQMLNAPEDNQVYQSRMNQPTLIYSAKGAVPGGTGAQTTSGLTSGDAYSNFANSQSNTVSSVSGEFIHHPEWTVLQGDLIRASMNVAIDSDLPGMISATVSANIYSYLGNNLLIPKGSRLIGQYSTIAGNGTATSRIFLIWNRIVTPDGLSMMINSPSIDELGRAGVAADSIERHLIALYGSGILYSLLGASAATVGVNNQTQPNSANQFQSQLSQQFSQTGQQELQSTMNIKNTLIAWQGKEVNVFVAHDLDLYMALASHRHKNDG